MSDFVIRQATEDDFPAVAAMHQPVWLKSNEGVMTQYVLAQFDGPADWPEQKYRPTLSRPGWAMWIAESDGELAGMTMFGPDPANPELVELDSLYVANEGQGIGTALLGKALALQPSDDVVLWCSQENHRARGWYENPKRGFELDGRTEMWEPLPGVLVPQLGYRLYRA